MAFTPVSLQSRIKAGCASIIDDLGLKISGGTENLTVATHTNISLPCVMLSLGEPEEVKGLTLATVQKTFAVQIYILDNDAGQITPEDEDRYMVWRERLMEPFNSPNRRRFGSSPELLLLPNCPEVFQLKVSPRFVFDKTLPQYQDIVTGFLVKADAAVRRN